MSHDSDYDDFEYKLADEESGGNCPFCGVSLRVKVAICPHCEQELDIKPPQPPAEMKFDEQGNPLPEEKPAKWSDLLELEEREGELPVTFYVVALVLLIVVALAAVISDAPVTAIRTIGVLLTTGSLLGLVTSYVWMAKELEGGLKGHLGTPLAAVVQMLRPDPDSPLPKLPAVDVGKWSLLLLGGGLLLLLAAALMGLAY
jgi:hypothetical protein